MLHADNQRRRLHRQRALVELRRHADVVEQQADGLVQALVAPGSLRQLAASGAVANVAPPAMPVEQSLDEGVQATGADVWQSAGYDGTGVKVVDREDTSKGSKVGDIVFVPSSWKVIEVDENSNEYRQTNAH